MENKINIVYIISNGHSGSTLADLLIASHPKVTGVGEIKRFHHYVSQKDTQYCTCGELISNCPLWSQVLKNLTHDYSLPVDSETYFEPRNADLFEEINRINSTTWIVDSSKTTGRLDQLLNSDRFNVMILHLIRDGRAVAYSQIKKRERNSTEKSSFKTLWETSYIRTLMNWKKFNQSVLKKGLMKYSML